ncbi:MAG: FAD-dependent oxidoreductase [Alphaproteobacteria bacterium]
MKIAVIGLGVAGLAVAARLAQAGHAVVGFEQFELMHERGSSHGDTRIIRLTPGEGDAYVRLAEQAAPIWSAWESENGAPLLHWSGGLMAGPPGSAFVQSCRALGARYGRPAAVYAPAIEGSLRFPDDWEVCRQSDCGVVYADDVRRFLIGKAQRLGVKLHANTAKPYEAAQGFDATIVTAGPWAAKLFPDLLRVERRVVGWFKVAGRVPVICVDDAPGVFGMPTPDGLYKIGLHAVGDVVDPDQIDPPNAADAALLAEHAGQYLRLDEPLPVRMKTCLYTLTADSNFLITPLAPNTLVLSCCSGHGFKYAPAYGEIAFDWIEGRETPELAAFAASPQAQTTRLGGAG